jgi:hypothetical protein
METPNEINVISCGVSRLCPKQRISPTTPKLGRQQTDHRVRRDGWSCKLARPSPGMWSAVIVHAAGKTERSAAEPESIRAGGPAYLAGALSFSNHWFTTNRSALGDALTANFVGQGYGARLEGGYRYAVLPAFAVTPYGAVQFQDFHTRLTAKPT